MFAGSCWRRARCRGNSGRGFTPLMSAFAATLKSFARCWNTRRCRKQARHQYALEGAAWGDQRIPAQQAVLDLRNASENRSGIHSRERSGGAAAAWLSDAMRHIAGLLGSDPRPWKSARAFISRASMPMPCPSAADGAAGCCLVRSGVTAHPRRPRCCFPVATVCRRAACGTNTTWAQRRARHRALAARHGTENPSS